MRSSRRFDPSPRSTTAGAAASRTALDPAVRGQRVAWRFGIALWLLAGACSGIKDQTPPGMGQDGGDAGGYRDGGVSWPLDVAPACGDGHQDPGEICDDGNTRDGDGCTADCKAVEANFSCPNPGAPCIYQVKCGDGVLGPGEQCDPPNVGNGCSAICRLEHVFV